MSLGKQPRKGYLSESIPINLYGIGRAGAPHVFEFSRRESFSNLFF